MPQKKDLQLKEYGISTALYRELYNYCLQYKEKKRKVRSCSGSVQSDRPELIERYEADIVLIEAAAKLSCPFQTSLFIRTVTEPLTTYSAIRTKGFRLSQGEFNNKRRQFYYLLALRLRKI